LFFPGRKKVVRNRQGSRQEVQKDLNCNPLIKKMENTMKNTMKYFGFVLAAAALIFTGAASVSADEGFTIHYEGEALERHRAVSGGETN
jgi:hypothetical protein